MKNFLEMYELMEEAPPMDGSLPGGGDPSAGGGAMGGGMDMGGGGMGGAMGGGAMGGMGGGAMGGMGGAMGGMGGGAMGGAPGNTAAAPPIQLKSSSVWEVWKKILDGDFEKEKNSGQNSKDMVKNQSNEPKQNNKL
jgi:hypothetical protein